MNWPGKNVAEKHSQYYLALIGRYDPVVLGAMDQEAITALRPDFDNIRRAWCWAVEANRLEWLDKSLDALAAYYEVTGLLDEAIQIFSHAAQTLASSEAAKEQHVALGIGRLLVKEMEFA